MPDSLLPLIVNADDYGISPGVSRGILELARAGRLSATSAMTAMPYWPEAAAQMRPLAGRFCVGLHLTLTDQTPLGPMPTLAPNGRLPGMYRLIRRSLLGSLPKDEIAAELDRQLDSFESHFGRPPDFIDGHHHAHQLRGVRERVLDVCATRYRSHGTWVRDTWDTPFQLARHGALDGAIFAILGRGLHGATRRRGIAANRGFTGDYFFGRKPVREMIRRAVAGAGARTMLMVHPGHPDAALAAVDSWVGPREEEWAYLMGGDFPRDLAESGLRVAQGAPFPN